MKYSDFFVTDPNERPLENIPADGGYTGIFRKIVAVGDSLSSGEFVATGEDGKNTYHDMFEYSWGQHLARAAGCTVLNFSRGGMTAGEYCESFAAQNGFWDPEKAGQAYVIALGVNDMLNARQPAGTVGDICPEHPEQNRKTFAGYYGRILQQYQAIQPDAKFFLVTIPEWFWETEDAGEIARAHAELMYSMAEYFRNTYVIDLFRYAPILGENFGKRFMLSGHMTPSGYLMMGRVIGAYIDYIIRHHMEDFRQVGFIGTPFRNTTDI